MGLGLELAEIRKFSVKRPFGQIVLYRSQGFQTKKDHEGYRIVQKEISHKTNFIKAK